MRRGAGECIEGQALTRILHIIQCANLGGMEQVALLLMRLTKDRLQWRVVSLNPIGALGPLLKEEGIPATGLKYRGWGGWRSAAAMYRAFRAEDADAVLMTGHNLCAMLALGHMARNNRVLYIHYHHTGVKPEWEWRMIYRLACRQFQTVAFVSDFIRREAEGIYPPVARLSRTVRNPYVVRALPSTEERLKARSSLGIPAGAAVVGNAGWLIDRKRFDVFLKVAKIVAKAVPEATFLIAGDGPLRGRLEAMAKELGIAKRIHWLGWQRDLRAFYLSLDVLLFNTDWDAVGRTPLEGLAHGVPVVASVAHGGLDEILNSEEYAFLYPRHDTEWLADKVLLLLRDKELGHQMVRAARQRLAEVGSPDQCARTIERLLRIDGNGA